MIPEWQVLKLSLQQLLAQSGISWVIYHSLQTAAGWMKTAGTSSVARCFLHGPYATSCRDWFMNKDVARLFPEQMFLRFASFFFFDPGFIATAKWLLVSMSELSSLAALSCSSAVDLCRDSFCKTNLCRDCLVLQLCCHLLLQLKCSWAVCEM